MIQMISDAVFLVGAFCEQNGFFQNFLMPPKGPLFGYFDFCKKLIDKKAQRIPSFAFFGTVRLFLFMLGKSI